MGTQHWNKTLTAGTAAAVVLLLTGCSGTQASLSAAAGTSKSATPTPTATRIANTACPAVNIEQVSAGATYVCTKDESGKLAWLDAAESKRVTDKLAAAKAAADKAAADKAAAEKAAAEKAAADAAAKAKADQDAAAAAAAKPAPAPAPAPPAPAAGSGCDPNYSGCVPIASDVDCAGGSGNGPAYVRGPIQVIGRDIYGLDSNHDGVACER